MNDNCCLKYCDPDTAKDVAVRDLFVDENVNLGPFFMYINDNVIRFFKDRYNISVQNNFDVNQYLEYTKLCFAKDNFYRRNRIYNGYSVQEVNI